MEFLIARLTEIENRKDITNAQGQIVGAEIKFKFLEDRDLIVGGDNEGTTSQTVELAGGTHTITLGPPLDFTPKTMKIVLKDTTVIAQTDNIELAIASVQKRQADKSDTEEKNIKEIKTALNQYNELMGNFSGLGLPIGWEFFPHCPTDRHPATLKNYDPQCKTVLNSLPEGAAVKKSSIIPRIVKTALADPWGFLKWLFVVIITGTLIGLGGPFWFDLASKLGGIRRKLGGAGSAAGSGQPSKPDDGRDAVIEEITADSKSKTAGSKTSKRRNTKQRPNSETPDD